jgi:hypothetical protein
VVLSFLYRLVHRTFGLLGLARRDAIAKDAEIPRAAPPGGSPSTPGQPSPLHLVGPGAHRPARRSRPTKPVDGIRRDAEYVAREVYHYLPRPGAPHSDGPGGRTVWHPLEAAFRTICRPAAVSPIPRTGSWEVSLGKSLPFLSGSSLSCAMPSDRRHRNRKEAR